MCSTYLSKPWWKQRSWADRSGAVNLLPVCWLRSTIASRNWQSLWRRDHMLQKLSKVRDERKISKMHRAAVIRLRMRFERWARERDKYRKDGLFANWIITAGRCEDRGVDWCEKLERCNRTKMHTCNQLVSTRKYIVAAGTRNSDNHHTIGYDNDRILSGFRIQVDALSFEAKKQERVGWRSLICAEKKWVQVERKKLTFCKDVLHLNIFYRVFWTIKPLLVGFDHIYDFYWKITCFRWWRVSDCHRFFDLLCHRYHSMDMVYLYRL